MLRLTIISVLCACVAWAPAVEAAPENTAGETAVGTTAPTATDISAQSPYDPFAHPAVIERRMTAYTEPIRVLDLAPEPGGRIATLGVEVGETVTDNTTPAIQLDPVLADIAVTQAEAGVAAAQAAVSIRKLEAERHQTELAFAEREFDRFERLAEDGRASAQIRDARELDRSRARSMVASDTGALAAAEAELTIANARVTEAQEYRRRHDLNAPAGWIVTQRLREVGAMVAPGEPVLRLADVSELLLAFRFDEAEVAAVRQADQTKSLTVSIAQQIIPARLRRVDITFDAVSRKRLTELVVSSAALVEASGGLVADLRLSVSDPGHLLIPNSLVSWRFERAVLKDQSGTEYVLSPLRRLPEAIIISRDALPAGTLLVAPE